jgi:6-phosphofructokinase
MGRHCGYLALVAAIVSEADFVFVPEWPPGTPIKKKRKFSSYIRKFKGIGCKTTSSYMVKIFVHFLIY